MSKNVVICEPSGGLGNQLFCIANAYAYSLRHNKRFYVTRFWKGITKDRPTYWEYILSYFKDNNHLAYPQQYKKVKSYTEPSLNYNQIPFFDYNVILKGYFQSEKYFEDYKRQVCKVLSLPDNLRKFAESKVDKYDGKTIVAIHIIRGDYFKSSDYYHILSEQYYSLAKKTMEEKLGYRPIYLYFTNEPSWVKEKFKDELEIYTNDAIIEGYKDYEEFAIMQQCHHFIISNSSFSWWAAYLSNTLEAIALKIVIAPINSNLSVPSEWIGIRDFYDGYFEGLDGLNILTETWRDDIHIDECMNFYRHTKPEQKGLLLINDDILTLVFEDGKILNANIHSSHSELFETIKLRQKNLISNKNTKISDDKEYNLYLINLNHRLDRYDDFIRNIKDFCFNVNKFDAVKHNKGFIGCSFSHLYLIKYAKENNLPYIIVSEDDMMIDVDAKTFKDILDTLLTNMDKWEVFNGSPTFSHYMDKFKNCRISESFNDKMLKTTFGLNTSFMIYNSSTYDKMLEYKFDKPIDVYISDTFTQDFLKDKSFCGQVSSYSDIDNEISRNNCMEFFRKQYKLLENRFIYDYNSETIIPKKIHFVFGLKEQTEEFNLVYAISIISAKLVINPQIIYFWYHYEPYGYWWDKVKSYLTLQKVNIPTHIGQKEVKKIAHKADIIRMEKLLEYGGIYLDMDTISIRNIDHILNNNFVIAKEKQKGLCNAIMLCNKNSSFLSEWWKNYEENFKTDGWGEASISYPFKLSKTNRDVLILKEESFLIPSYDDVHKIFEGSLSIPNNLLILHLWESFSMKYYTYNNLNEIIASDCMYSKMVKHLIENYNLNNYL